MTYNKGNEWINCLIAAILLFFSFSQMTVFNSIAPVLIEVFDINNLQLGYLSSLYLYGLVLFFFPSGYLFDNYPLKSTFLIASILAITGTLFFSFSNNFFIAGSGRFLTGMMHAAIFTGCLKMVSLRLSSSLAMGTSLVITIGFLGGFFTQAPFVILMNYSSWRFAQMLLVLFALIAVVLFFLKVEQDPGHNTKSNNKVLDDIKKITSFNQNWLCSLYVTLMNFPALLLGALWGNLYLVNVHGVSHTDSSIIISVFYVGIIIGTPFFGWLSDKIKNRKVLIKGGALFLLLTTLTLLLLSNLERIYLSYIFFVMGFLSSIETIGYPIITENNPKTLTASALGFASILVIGIGAIFQGVFGYFIDGGSIFTELHIQTNKYQVAFIIIPFSVIIAFLISFFIKDVFIEQTNKRMI